MPVTTEIYDQLKIDKLRHFLGDMEAKGYARPFEIFVDSLKVVPKTTEIKDFDNYEYYINEDTQKIRILIYNTTQSPRNDQYCFYMKGKEQQPLNGLGDLDGIIQEKLSARDREHETKKLKEELEHTKAQLQEAEEYSEQLEQQLEESKSNKFKLGNLNLVELGGALIEKLAIKNSPALEKIGLAGLVNPVQPVTGEQEMAASFQKKNMPGIKEEHLQYIPLFEQLEAMFGDAEIETVMKIIERFGKEPAQLKTVAELLNTS